MRRTLIFTALMAMAILTSTSCGGNKEKKDSDKAEVKTEDKAAEAKQDKGFPWDFPEGVKLSTEVGQYVLSPYTFIKKLTESEKPANETFIFYSTKLSEYGEPRSKVDGGKVEAPNSLIIPIPKGQKAKVGDIILTWWQSGSGMQRAIVTDASDPETPKVCYLDLGYNENSEKPGLANKHANEQIKPSTFVALEDGKWQPGAQIAAFDGKDWKAAKLINVSGDKVLALGFAGKIYAYKKSNCKLIPIKQDIKVGDNVHAVWVSTYKDGYKVTKIDKKIGRVWVENSQGKTEIVNILEVAKGL